MADVTRTYGIIDAKANQAEVQSSQDRRHPRLKRMNGHSNSESSSSTGGRDLNYCEVYFVSPSKRLSREDLQTVPTSPQNSSNSAKKRRDQFKSQTLENSFAFPTYFQNQIFDPNYDSFETRSHFSDSAATIPSHQLARTRSNNVTFSNCTEERIHANRGSLKRSKGRSNQSLCSCDAETEILPNPNRPLYQYSFDSKNKNHTYTCEQNAQILMRLERERRKSVGMSAEKQINDTKVPSAGTCDDSSFEYPVMYQDTSNSIESDSTTDVDIIPPPPPPISLSRKAVSYQQGTTKGYEKPTESMLNDCTSTILNCANVGHAGNSKPDLCNVNQSRSNQENIPLTPYPYIRDDTYVPCFKSKAEDSVFFYHQESPQYAPNFDNRPQSGKFNTIGPSSYSSKYTSQKLANGYNPLTGPFTSNSLANERYFSQSLSNFSFNGQSSGPNDGYQWHQHNLNDSSSTPYTQFRTRINGLSSSFGESVLANSSYTTLGSSTSGIKEKFNLQQQQQQQSQQSSSSMPWKHRQCPSRGSSSSGTSSLKFDPSRHWLAVSSILLIVGAASVAVPLALRVAASAPFEERLRAATQLLDDVPLIDGHNDLPWNIRKFLHNKLNDFHFDEDLRNVMPWARSHWSHTDLKRLKQGRVAAQFWAAYVPCEAQHRDAVQLTLEQIDVIKRLTERYSKELTTCTSAADIIEAHKSHKICSLTGVEGGHSLGGSLAVLRTLYAIGVRYLTLTSTCHTPWADSSHADAPKYDVKHGGLTVFGKTIIREMNRLGMIVDLSHVSTGTMRDALATSEAPVIFSHSSAYELCNSSRNVQDDFLLAVAKNGGLVMVNFYSKFLSCSDNSTVQDAVAHINHIKRIAGIDHVGLGAGYDGINFTPKGLEDVSSYPTLFAELLGEGWSIEDLTKLAGQNFLRVMTEVERIRDTKKLSGIRPYEDHPNFRTEDPYNCTSS